MAPESTRSSSSTASRRLRGLLRRTLRVVRPISDTLAAGGAAGQARRIAWTRSTAGGYCGTPEEVVARIRARARLGVQGVVFFLHDRAEPETLRLLADEVVPAVRDL